MEDRYAVARVDTDGWSNVVVEDGFSSADEALAGAVRRHGHTGDEYYACRLVPIDLDKKPSLVILREQTAAIASLSTSTATRTEQIYHELTALRESIDHVFKVADGGIPG